MTKFFLSLLFVVAVTGCASTENNSVQRAVIANDTNASLFSNAFEGNWIGELQSIGSERVPFKAAESNIIIRLRIQQQQAELFFKYDSAWSPIAPTRFKLDVKGPNAVIYMQDIAPDVTDKTGFGGWVESKVLLLTKKDDDAVYVSMQRAVNNFLKKSDEENSRFFILSVGELKRVDDMVL